MPDGPTQTPEIATKKPTQPDSLEHIIEKPQAGIPTERTLLSYSPEALSGLVGNTPADRTILYRVGAEAAAKEKDFATRNRDAALTVAAIEAADAVANLHEIPPVSVNKMFHVMFLACQRSGQKYEDLFDADGNAIPSKEAEYIAAHSYAGDRAASFLPLLVHAAGIDMDRLKVREAAGSISYTDALAITLAQMGMTLPEGLTNMQVSEMLGRIVGTNEEVKKDEALAALRQQLSAPEIAASTMILPDMPRDERVVKDLALRLAHATWAETQVAARVPWEIQTTDAHKSERMDKSDFNPSGVYQKAVYDKLRAGEGPSEKHPEGIPPLTHEEALLSVAYEVYKDARQYKKKLGQPEIREPVRESQELRIIPESKMLVQPDYQLTHDRLAAAVVRAARRDVFENYPSLDKRIGMSEEDYLAWVNGEGTYGGIRRSASLFTQHMEAYSDIPSPHALAARARGEQYGYDGSQKFPEGTFPGVTDFDSNGAPLSPYAKELLINGLAVWGPGEHWGIGPHDTTTEIMMRQRNGKLEMRTIIRSNDAMPVKRHAFPGGFEEKRDASAEAAGARELGEETGVKEKTIRDIERKLIYVGPAPDGRTTVHASINDHVYVRILTDEQAEEIERETKPGDDARDGVQWEAVTREALQELYGGHGEYGLLAVQAWQNETGLVVDEDGNTGKRAV